MSSATTTKIDLERADTDGTLVVQTVDDASCVMCGRGNDPETFSAHSAGNTLYSVGDAHWRGSRDEDYDLTFSADVMNIPINPFGERLKGGMEADPAVQAASAAVSPTNWTHRSGDYRQ